MNIAQTYVSILTSKECVTKEAIYCCEFYSGSLEIGKNFHITKQRCANY